MPEAATWNRLFGGAPLAAAELQALAAVAKLRSVAEGAEVFVHDEPALALVAVLDGDVALGWRTADSVFHFERPLSGPAWLDLSSAWLGERHAMDARASSRVLLLELNCDDLRPQLERHPALGQRLIAGLAREVQSLAVNTHELMHKDAPARFAAWLLQRCKAVDTSGRRAVVKLAERKRDIASQLAITPETLSRLMRSFSRQGVIEVAGYTLRVLDLPALRQLAQGS
ncbi:MAG: Crp/Fnr family transcriptional regulator [Rubrivivax sp.]|nr:Crp/Fnr family transcriptional regulator [Rubrivivax sp.]MDP3086277.1 Crp/Fnr family transcriptional regulator [Rubrivivax sp.]